VVEKGEAGAAFYSAEGRRAVRRDVAIEVIFGEPKWK
jgi:hypothetical protein